MKYQRLFAVLTALCLLTGMLLPSPAAAQGESSLSLSRVSGAVGEQVTVEVLLQSPVVAGGSFDVHYDPAALRLDDAVRGEGNYFCYVNPASGGGSVRLSFANTQPLGTAMLARLTFTVCSATPADGTAVTVENARFGDIDSKPVTVAVTQGEVARRCVRLSMAVTDTAEAQAMRCEVMLDGQLHPAGGNFTLQYDPAVLEPTAVLPLAAAGDASMTWHAENGTVRVAFAGTEPLENGRLCAVIFRAIGIAGTSSPVTITDVRCYDALEQPLDVETESNVIHIVLPSERDPKLWIIGGALEEDGSTTIHAVLHGRGKVLGGSFTILLPDGLSADISAINDAAVNVFGNEIRVAFARDTAFDDGTDLVSLSITGGTDGTVIPFDHSSVRLYAVEEDVETPFPVVDLRNGRLSKTEQVAAVVDAVQTTEEPDGTQQVTVALDVADLAIDTEAPTDKLIPVLALYDENDRLIGMDLQQQALDNGTAELILTADTTRNVGSCRVFLLEGDQQPSPLCPPVDIAQ